MLDRFFTWLASQSSRALGHPLAFVLAVSTVIAWGASGPLFGFSDTWQLVINTSTTIMTFLAVFLIQNSQNRDSAAMQAKLDEILRALDSARSQFIGIEHLTEGQIEGIRSALEREVAGEKGKQATADDTVDELLKRI